MAINEPIQWYPGHMAKAGRQIKEKLKLIDTVVEVLDARVPIASRNPDISQYTAFKQHIILLNKSFAVRATTISAAWMRWAEVLWPGPWSVQR